jgi:hypothetical protein
MQLYFDFELYVAWELYFMYAVLSFWKFQASVFSSLPLVQVSVFSSLPQVQVSHNWVPSEPAQQPPPYWYLCFLME